MNASDILAQLAPLANATRKKVNIKNGASQNHFGVPMGKLRALAKAHMGDHELALELWATGNADAQFLAAMIFDPNQLTVEGVAQMVDGNPFFPLVDELMYSSVCLSPIAETLRNAWIVTGDECLGRAGWALVVAELTTNKAPIAHIEEYLAIIARDMPSALPRKMELMNRAFVEIAIHYPDYLPRVLSLAEQLGVYRDQKVPKGCTSAYAPEWIAAVLRRKEK